MTHTHPNPKTRAVVTAAVGSTVLGAAAALVLGAGPATATPMSPMSGATRAHGTHAVHVGGVTLHVPSSWHVRDVPGLPGCIVDPDARPTGSHQRAYGANDCQLQVLAGRTLPTDASPDHLYFRGDPAQCLRNGHDVPLRTTDAEKTRVGGATAQYRRFARPCLKHTAEQWFVTRKAGVIIERTRRQPATEAAALRAVGSVSLPHGRG